MTNITTNSAESKHALPNMRMSSSFNRIAYCLLLLAGIIMLIKGDIMTAASNIGLSLVFDPFNPMVKWNDRPLYQRVWLFIQVIFVIGLFIYGIFFH